MKKLGLLLITTAFILGSGFFKKKEDGSYDTDTLKKQASEVSAQATAEADKISKQAGEMSEKAIKKAKKAAASMDVKQEEILADLNKSLAEIKQKVAGMDTAKLVAYANKYTEVFADNKNQIADYTAKLKDLKWTEKLGSKGKELKGQLKDYQAQYEGLKGQCTVYMNKLKSCGIDPAAFGIDLSAYGL